MSGLRTVLAGLVLGALCSSLLQGCESEVCSAGPGCGEPRQLVLVPGAYVAVSAQGAADAGAQAPLRLVVDEARTRVTERSERDGRLIETEYEVVRSGQVPADQYAPF